MEVTIENLIASTNLNTEINLEKVSGAIEDISYDPDVFPGAVYRMDKPHVAVVIFDSGKLMCTNARSVDEAQNAFEAVVTLLRSKDLIRVQFICPNCGSYLEEGDEKCPECGEVLKK